MEAAPPSYEKATLVNAWDIIAQYLPSSDLCSAALVCEEWHAVFVPHLWGNPASHFSHENDRIYVALTRFKRTLLWARLSVRSLTHTLHLPPAHAEIYNGPHADWLREVLDRLPNLQSLIVRGLPFFDHSALVALKYRQQEERIRQPSVHAAPDGVHELAAPISLLPPIRPRAQINPFPTFGLRLLDASRCTNVTATGLCQAMKRLDSLIYLDLSGTYPARDHAVLDTLRTFSGLQVLKLKGISLRDEELEVLAGAIGRRVRSLDVRQNQLTDRSARVLLEACFISVPQNATPSQKHASGVRSPSLIQYLGADMLAIYQGQEFEGYLRNAFTSSFVSRLAIEDAPEGGLTHLYISGNHLSVEGLTGLARSGRLHVLNASVDTTRPHPTSAISPSDSQATRGLPGAEKLTRVLADYASDTLTYLKINHELVTKRLAKSEDDMVVPGSFELDTVPVYPNGAVEVGNNPITELPGSTCVAEMEVPQTICELSADPPTPPLELPGDSVYMIVSPATGDAPQATAQEEAEYERARRGSAVAPEVVSDLADVPDTLHPSSAIDSASTVTSFADQYRPTSRSRTFSNVASDRKARMRFRNSQSDAFHPGVLPHLKTLVLTNVPPFSPDEEAAERLLKLIQECAEEAALAQQQARFDYTLPPGRRESMSALRESTRTFFALEHIILEMAPEKPVRKNSKASKWRHDTTRSLTEDRDSEALWSASETDFSFFGESDHSDFPTLDREPPVIMSAMAEKQLVTDIQRLQLSKTNSRDKTAEPEVPRVDNIAKLSRFRKAKKAAYQTRLAHGDADPEVEGYWPGVVKVIRNSSTYDASADDEEGMDYYGNRFSARGVYR